MDEKNSPEWWLGLRTDVSVLREVAIHAIGWLEGQTQRGLGVLQEAVDGDRHLSSIEISIPQFSSGKGK